MRNVPNHRIEPALPASGRVVAPRRGVAIDAQSSAQDVHARLAWIARLEPALVGWDAEGWRHVQEALDGLLDAVGAQSQDSAPGAPRTLSRGLAHALRRLRREVAALSLPEPAWEAWWHAAKALDSLESALSGRVVPQEPRAAPETGEAS